MIFRKNIQVINKALLKIYECLKTFSFEKKMQCFPFNVIQWKENLMANKKSYSILWIDFPFIFFHRFPLEILRNIWIFLCTLNLFEGRKKNYAKRYTHINLYWVSFRKHLLSNQKVFLCFLAAEIQVCWGVEWIFFPFFLFTEKAEEIFWKCCCCYYYFVQGWSKGKILYAAHLLCEGKRMLHANSRTPF